MDVELQDRTAAVAAGDAAPAPMLEARGLHQYYGGSHILRDVSVSATPGRVTVLLGRNGVGKTSLLKSLMGLVPIRAGSVSLAGRDISHATPYQRARWIGFMDPWADPQGLGFQLVQSLMAIGSGGLFGQGWGQGKQKLFWLPIQYADFIFAAFAEEMGLIGSAVIILLFIVLAWRGFAIAGAAREPFHALMAIALTTTVVVQALINIGVVTASLPTTGIPLPFLSFGGTSLLLTLFSMGLVLNVSRQAQKHLTVVDQGQGQDA